MLGVGAFGLTAATAASLGGLTTARLGASNNAVASCDSDGVGLTYTNTYGTAGRRYRTTGVTVTGLNSACSGKSLRLMLASAGASLGTGTIASLTAASTQTITMTTLANTRLVTRVAVVITG